METLTYQDFRPLSLQLSAFLPDGVLTKQKILEVYPKLKDFFSGDPVVLPLPPLDQVPLQVVRQVPQVTLKNDAGWQCQTFYGSARLSYTGFMNPGGLSLPEATQQAEVQLRRLLDVLDQQSVNRLGIVLNRVAEHPKPGLFLARHFCKERWESAPLNRPESFELHAHKAFQLANSGTSVNSWARNKSAQLTNGQNTQPVVLFEQDMNTLPEAAAVPTQTAIDLLSEIARALDTVLQQYYPEAGSLDP